MDTADTRLDIDAEQTRWRFVLLNRLSLLFALLGLPLWLLLLVNWQSEYVAPLIVYLCLWGTALARNENFTLARSWVLCIILLGTGIQVLDIFGLEGSGRLIIGAACIVAGILINARAAGAMLLVGCLTFGAYAYFAVVDDGEPFVVWTGSIMVMFVLVATIIVATDHLLRRNARLIQKLGTEVALRTSQEEAVRSDLDRLEFVTENTTDTIFSLELDGTLNYVSPSVRRLMGYTSEETMQMGVKAFLGDDFESVTSHISDGLQVDRGIDPETPFTLQIQTKNKAGSIIDVEITAAFLRDEAGKPVGVVGAARDVSDRVRLDNAMNSVISGTRRSRDSDFLLSLTHSLSRALAVRAVMIGRIDDDEIDIVAACVDRTSITEGRYPIKDTPTEQVLARDTAITSYAGNVAEQFPHDETLRRFSFETYIGTPLSDGHGGHLGVLLLAHDARLEDMNLAENLLLIFAGLAEAELLRKSIEDESNRTRAQLIQSQKLDSIGQLAGGIAHDFNNLLVIIQGYIELSRDMVADQPTLKEYHAHIEGATERAVKLTRQLLSFSRRQVLTKEPVDLNELLSDIQPLLTRLLPVTIAVDFDSEPDLGLVDVDKNQMEQSIVNLCVNARDAMPTGGTISFRTSNRYVDEELASHHQHVEPGWFVELKVSDTGCGMEEAVVAQIFEPFFTTKPEGLGTGLGLSVMLGVVEQHGGFVEVTSVEGRGTAFSIVLPIQVSESPSTPEDESVEPGTGSETILLVEDEELVRDLARLMLESAGYKVLSAANGLEAIGLFEEHQDEIALAILDVVLPGISGKELSEALLKLDPTLPVLFASGYAPGGVHTNFVLETGLTLLQKPYSLEELLHNVRKMIDQAA